MRYLWVKTLLAAMAALLLTGCSDLVDRDQPKVEPGAAVTLEASHPVGQTFVARHAGLSAVEVWLQPRQGGQGEIHLHLRAHPQEADDLAAAVLPLARVTTPGFYRFSFPSLRDSHSRYLYAFLEVKGESEVLVGAGAGDTYLDGALHRDHQPLDAQMAFRLTYDLGYVLLDLGQAVASGLGLLAAAGLLYVVPGWALLVLFRSKCDTLAVHHWAEGLGVAVGLSLALYPLLLLWTEVVGLHLGPLYAWLPLAGGLVVLLWHYRPWRWQKDQIAALLKHWLRSKAIWPDVALVVVVALASIGRLLAVRSLDMPLWDDSVQHTVVVKRILESGGLFQSWAPYAPYRTFSFHFGFHANVAAWAWLTRMNTPQSVIWAGQILNLLAVLTLYPLAHRIKGVWAGVIAVLAAGILTSFPAYYTNWGRYPQMSGQAVLPVAAWWLWVTLRKRKTRCMLCILGGAYLVAGMALTYYRMPFHYFAFASAALLILLKSAGREGDRWYWLMPIVIVTIAGILLSPWLHNVGVRHWPAVAPDRERGGIWQQAQTIHIGWAAPKAAVVFLGTLVGIWVGGAAALPVVWLWLLVGLPVLQLTPLPGVQFLIQEFTIETSLYILQALIWGAFGGHLLDKLSIRQGWWSAVVALIVVGMGVWKLPSLLTIIDRGHDLSTRPDIRAARWISEYLPDEAFFLNNGIIYTDGYSAVGGDAGWWLPILTRRSVVIPPHYALHVEEPNEPGYGEAVNNLVQSLFENSPSTPEGQEAICSFPQPITHVYLGQQRGMVAKTIYPPPHPMLPADLLLQSPAFRLIYHQDRVMIFEFDRDICPKLGQVQN